MKSMWPPSNLNPLDCRVWTHVETKACVSSHPNLNAVKASVEREWALISDSNLVGAVKAFRSRLEKCLAAEGGGNLKNDLYMRYRSNFV